MFLRRNVENHLQIIINTHRICFSDQDINSLPYHQDVFVFHVLILQFLQIHLRPGRLRTAVPL